MQPAALPIEWTCPSSGSAQSARLQFTWRSPICVCYASPLLSYSFIRSVRAGYSRGFFPGK